jgi:pimeloyl-ACP methyl ester carboxylesterase
VRISIRPTDWRKPFRGLLAVLLTAGLFGALPASPAQAQTRRPLLLVGGTFATAHSLDIRAREFFESQGYTVYTMGLAQDRKWTLGAELLLDLFAAGYGFGLDEVSGNGTASIDDKDSGRAEPNNSAALIRAKVDQILAQNPGADKVDIIGHSQGGTAARWYVRQSGQDKVGTLISLAGAEGGVPVNGVTENAWWDFACDLAAVPGELDVCEDMIVRDGVPTDFLAAVNQDDPTPGNVAYYYLYGREEAAASGNYSDLFAELGFTSKYVDAALQHVHEWEYEEMRQAMLDALNGDLSA